MPFNLYKYFPGKSKWFLLLEALEFRISKRIPEELRVKKIFFQRMLSSGQRIIQKENGIRAEFEINGKTKHFFLRNDSSDFSVFTQIILDGEYSAVIEIIKQFDLSLKNFIDAGANIGFSSIYLSAFYPDAKFICLEPHRGNFAALKNNISLNASNENYALVQKALWSKPILLSGDTGFRDGKDWSFRVKEDSNTAGEIKGITIEALMQEYNFSEVDFLKIDIEGSEAELFSDIEYLKPWISQVKVMSIEIHDETNARFKIENILQEMRFRLFSRGELTIAVNQKYIGNK